MRTMEAATEQSPLLNHEADSTDAIVQENGNPNHDTTHNQDDVPLAEEPSTRELLAMMAAIWMGVFFAALGV